MAESIKELVKRIIDSELECIYVKDFSYNSGSSVDFESVDDYIKFCKSHDIKTTFYSSYGSKEDDYCNCQFFSTWNSMHVGYIANEEEDNSILDNKQTDYDYDEDYDDKDDEFLDGPSYFELRGIEEAKSNENDFIDKYSKKIYDSNILTNYNMFLLHTNRELYADYFLHEFPDYTPDDFEEEKHIACQFLEESKEKLNNENLSKEEKQRIGEKYEKEFTFLIRKVFAKRANATETINRMYRERAEQRKKDMIEIPKLIRQEVSEYPELGSLKTKASIEKYADKLRKEWKDEKKYNFLTLKQIKYIIEEEIEKL